MAALITSAIVWLHFCFWQNAGALWRDETNLVSLAKATSLTAMAQDSFPVMMPLLVHFWMLFAPNQSDASLRQVGVLIGLSAPVALWLAVWMARRSPPLISLTLFGLNSTLIFYGDSLRAHGLGSVFIVVTFAAMWWFLKRPSWGRTGFLTVAAILSVQTLFQNAVLFAAICCGAWWLCLRRGRWHAAGKIFVACLVTASSLLPYWNSLRALPGSSTALRSGLHPLTALLNLEAVISFPFWVYGYVWAICLFAILRSACLRHTAQNVPPKSETTTDDLPLFAGATSLAVVFGFAGFLWFAALPTQPWYFLPPTALLAIGFDFGFPLRSRSRFVGWTGLGLVLITAMIAVPVAHHDLNRRFTNVDLIAQQLADEASPQDFIFITPWYYGISFDRYFKGVTPWQTLPPLADHLRHRYDLFRNQSRDPRALQPVFEKITETLQHGHRIWVAGTMSLPRTGVASARNLNASWPAESVDSDIPYISAWSSQIASFLTIHSLQFQRSDDMTNFNISSDEDFQLLSASGWRTNQP